MSFQKKNEAEKISLLQHLTEIAAREELSPEQVKELIINSFRSSYCTEENEGVELEFVFDKELLVKQKLKIVEKKTDPKKEITEEETKNKNNLGEIVDGFFFLPLDINKFSFGIIQRIRQRFQEEIKKAHFKRKEKFQDKKQQGQLVRGQIRMSFNKQSKFILVDLEGGGIGFWSREEFEKTKIFNYKKSFLFLIDEVLFEENQQKIVLTRNGEEFIKKIFELEIPEIKNRIIKIHSIIQVPGIIKIIVGSTIPSLDPVGTCIGRAASRIKSIRDNFSSDTRIELASWDFDKEKLFFNLLLPAKVITILKNDESNWEIVVPLKHYLTNLKNRLELVKKIGEHIQKNIKISIFENAAENSISVWNGNLSYSEYLELKNENDWSKH